MKPTMTKRLTGRVLQVLLDALSVEEELCQLGPESRASIGRVLRLSEQVARCDPPEGIGGTGGRTAYLQPLRGPGPAPLPCVGEVPAALPRMGV